MGEVEAHVRAGQGLFEPLAGDGVDAAVGRGGDSLVAALAQNGNGLRADQAGAADDDDLHGLPSLVDDWRPLNANTSEKKSGPQRARIISVRNTPLAVPLATERNPSKRRCRGICSLAKCSGNQVSVLRLFYRVIEIWSSVFASQQCSMPMSQNGSRVGSRRGPGFE